MIVVTVAVACRTLFLIFSRCPNKRIAKRQNDGRRLDDYGKLAVFKLVQKSVKLIFPFIEIIFNLNKASLLSVQIGADYKFILIFLKIIDLPGISKSL